MIPKEIEEIKETARIDLKGELPHADRDGVRDFLSDICAFANTEGGDLVYGLEQDKRGVATRLIGQVINADADVMRWQNMVADSIEPGCTACASKASRCRPAES